MRDADKIANAIYWLVFVVAIGMQELYCVIVTHK